jgi:hypothetical protein
LSDENKKCYKKVNPADIEFSDLDIETLLERYEWKCAYSGTPLQGYEHRASDAFQLEYVEFEGRFYLVPVCRRVNCSKKGLTDPEKLKKWAQINKIPYPFNYITPEEYINNL